jgi:polyamine oxidase
VRGAATVLLTVSVGVLQSAQIRFVPELPISKLQPLHEISMAAYTKVYLAFGSKFWPELQRHILIAHPRRGMYGIVTHLGSGIARYPPADSHILCVTVTGDEARRVEALSDGEVCKEAMELFAAVWAEQVVPRPLAMHVCRWSTDPLFLGAYSVRAGERGARGVRAQPSLWRHRGRATRCQARAAPLQPSSRAR